jgi:hypothetical protein
MNGTEKKYTAWHYAGCGCAILFVLAILGIGGCFWMMTNWGRQLKSELEDPEARAAKARSLLGYDELPEGYHPGISFSVPLVMDVVILGDKELPAGDDLERMESEHDMFEERGFLYFKMRAFGQERENVREEMDLDVDFRAEKVVGEGEIEAGGATVRYTAELGETILGTGRVPSVSVELEIDCRDGFFREAVWFEPIPGAEPGQPEIPEESLVGTPADEGALREFLDHFRFCG